MRACERRRMKCAHIGNPANVAWEISRAQRALGYPADVWVPQPSPFGFHHDRVFRLPRGLRWLELRDYDVLHLHAFRLLPHALETLIPSRQKIVLHHHGTDVRLPGEPLGARWAHARLCNVDLVRQCPEATPVPLPLNTSNVYRAQGVTVHGTVLHLESAGDRTGTRFVEAACRKLDLTLYPTDRTVGSQPRDRWLRLMSSAEVVVGKVARISGMPGMVMLEALAMGKPALCWVSEACRKIMGPDCPVVTVTPETLLEALRWVTGDAFTREYLRDRGKDYVRTYHRPEDVARKCLEAYGDPA